MTRLYHQEITEDIADLEVETHHVLALLEREFPVSLHVIVFHLLRYLHYNKTVWTSLRMMNRWFPESTVLESYRFYA